MHASVPTRRRSHRAASRAFALRLARSVNPVRAASSDDSARRGYPTPSASFVNWDDPGHVYENEYVIGADRYRGA